MIEEAILSILKADPTISSMIRDRIFPDDPPQTVVGDAGILPCVVYEIESEGRSETLCDTDGNVRCMVRTDCVANSRLDANRLAIAVRHALNRYSGTPAIGPKIKNITLDDVFNVGDTIPGRLRRALYWAVWYLEDSD